MAENNSPRQAPRRDGMIHCEKCGEDYSATYKRCPFCDERPSRGVAAGSGRRAAGKRAARNPGGGGYRGGSVDLVQILKVVISLALVIAAIYIVVTKAVPFFFGGKEDKPDPKPGTSQVDPDKSKTPDASKPAVDPGQSEAQQPDQPAVPVPPTPAAPKVDKLKVNKTDFTLAADESYTLKVEVSPKEAAEYLTFASSDTDIVRVSASGTVSNVNSGSKKIAATVTVTCGDETVEVTVHCRGGSHQAPPLPEQPVKPVPKPEPKPDPKPEVKPQPEEKPQPSGPVEKGTEGVIYNAEGGLNIRSGPGTQHDVVASGKNGGIVRILGEEDGWYKVDYQNGKVGYVSKDYIKVR